MTLQETRGRAARQSGSPSPLYVAPLAVLLVRGGALAGQRLIVRHIVATLGRGRFADLRLPDPSVGALHARLELRQGIWSLTALGAGHPVRVDGESVSGEIPLSPGSTIRLGEVVLLFEPRDSFRVDRTPPAAEASLPEVAVPPPRRARRRFGFLLLVLLGLLLLAGGIVLELTR